MVHLDDLLERASARRSALLERLRAEGTDCWRLLHGATEGLPGVAVDRYGELVLVQLFRAAPDGVEEPLADALRERAAAGDVLVVVDRRGGPSAVRVSAAAERNEFVCSEAGMRCLVRAEHAGQDPWLFLDLRAGRRMVRTLANGRSVLNLFAYTCTAGIAAAQRGASEVLNVDFSQGWLDVGRRNARLNDVDDDRVRFLRQDCLAVLRQLAGMPVARRSQRRTFRRVAPRTFDLVVLDPPRLAKSAFGTVDLVGDYQSLFKPAWLATAPGGHLLATNNVASVDRDVWVASLWRCADKAGRPIARLEIVEPDADFPSPDGRPPLKVVLCSA
ncbi:MAG: class I SAM-dependent rRNA methyltransferase [Planctomycetes bacterium]|nr:class I SAM-dependent rRNA methyltransferase [Planctomycetota bacterium]